ncbi:MAG: hypothetical protein V4547_17930 [Bacteroidota bacterium]
MAKVIQINKLDGIYYHVSHNPNNGDVTMTTEIEKAAVYESDWDLTFIPMIIKIIKYKHPVATITAINTK